MISIILTFVLVVIVWLISLLRFWNNHKFAKTVPANPWHTLLRCGALLGSKNIIQKSYEHEQKYGRNSILWMGPYPIFITTEPEILKDILTAKNCTEKPIELYGGIDFVVGTGLISESDPSWTRHRKLINKVFSNKSLISFLPAFNVEVNKFINELKMCVDNKEDLDMMIKLRGLTIRNATRTTLKRDMDLTKFNPSFMSQIFGDILYSLMNYCLQPFMSHQLVQTFWKPFNLKAAEDGIKVFHKFFDESVHIARNDVTEKSFLANEYGVLDCCINVGEQKDLEENETRVLLMHFFIAAFETVSTTLYFALLLLSMYPEHQDRVYEEVHNIINDSDTEITAAHLDDMKFVEMIFNETMRVLPIVPIVFRRVVHEDLKLSNNITLPVGQIIGIDMFNLHRSTDIWGPDAGSFNPDNFLPSNVAARHPYAFIPFTKGQRFCIGWKYATLLFKMSLAKLITTFKFSTDVKFEDLTFESHMTLKLVEEPRLKMERRQAAN